MSIDLKIEKAANKLHESYQKHHELQQWKHPLLPNRESIFNLIYDTQRLMFPGVLRKESTEFGELIDWTQSNVSSVFQQIVEALKQILNWYEIEKKGEESKVPKAESADQIAVEFLEAIPLMRDMLSEDMNAIFEGDPAANTKRDILLSYPGFQALSIHRVAHFFYNKSIPLLPRIMSECVHSKTGIDIHPGAKIGHGTMIDHGTGIVIGETSIIGNHVRLYQGVTIGALTPDKEKGKESKKRHPTIEDKVVLYAEATILGGDTVVGANSIIGGNVWLTHSVPPFSKIVSSSKKSKSRN